jgi:hypothetical protein
MFIGRSAAPGLSGSQGADATAPKPLACRMTGAATVPTVVPPLQGGLERLVIRVRRALPWADLWRPCRAWRRKRRNIKKSASEGRTDTVSTTVMPQSMRQAHSNPGGRASRRAGSDGASPSQNHERLFTAVKSTDHGRKVERDRPALRSRCITRQRTHETEGR